jgi:hypothetical protein
VGPPQIHPIALITGKRLEQPTFDHGLGLREMMAARFGRASLLLGYKLAPMSQFGNGDLRTFDFVQRALPAESSWRGLSSIGRFQDTGHNCFDR